MSRRAVVMGLGLFGGGVGAARHLARLGYQVLVTDLRSESELAPSLEAIADSGVELRLGEHRDEDFTTAELVVMNPAVKPGNHYIDVARAAGVAVTTELRLFLEACPARVAGITGSNGKTTAAHMTAAMLRAVDGARVWLGGNLGGSLLQDLPEMTPDDLVVLEISSFQLMDLDSAGISPPVAAITNITPNHLDWHRDLAEYVRAKAAIFRHQDTEDVAVLNMDDPVTKRLRDSAPGRVIGFSLLPGQAEARREGERFLLTRPSGETVELFRLQDLRVPGEHNQANALTAACVAHAMGASPAAIAAGLRGFRGVEHRLELVGEVRGVRWFNDSIATTPESTLAALASFRTHPVHLLLGGSSKGLSFDALADAIASHPSLAVVYVHGPTGTEIGEAIRRACARRPNPARGLRVEPLRNFAEAIERCARGANPGSVFLMSPACASFYEYAPGKKFANFEERGRHFKELVAGLQVAK